MICYFKKFASLCSFIMRQAFVQRECSSLTWQKISKSFIASSMVCHHRFLFGVYIFATPVMLCCWFLSILDFFSSNFYLFSQVDIPNFLLTKCLKRFMIHLECYAKAKERGITPFIFYFYHLQPWILLL